MEAIMCVMGCGFFGSPETGNICSKCYEELINTQKISMQIAEAKVRDIGYKIIPLIDAVNRSGDETWSDVKDDLSNITARYSQLSTAVSRGRRGNDVDAELSEITAIVATLTSAVDRKLGYRIDGEDEIMAKIRHLTVKTKVEKRNQNRCECCDTKVELLGFECRCGGLFCDQHRMPELHVCDLDYKRTNRSKINPHLTFFQADNSEYRI